MRCFRLPCMAAATVLLALFTSVPAFAKDGDAPVRVDNVKFNSGVSPTKDSNMVIKLTAVSNPDPNAANNGYLDNVRVVVTLGYKSAASTSPTDLVYYRSEVEIATLKLNDSRTIAFWLPRDVVERDRYNREPEFWAIDLFVAGEQLPPSKDLVSRSLLKGGNPQANLTGFKSMAESKISQTEGVLRPTYLTYNGEVERPDKIPAYVRKEAAR